METLTLIPTSVGAKYAMIYRKTVSGVGRTAHGDKNYDTYWDAYQEATKDIQKKMVTFLNYSLQKVEANECLTEDIEFAQKISDGGKVNVMFFR